MPQGPAKVLRSHGLVFTSDASPGITRERDGDRFIYRDPTGRVVKSEKTLQRISQLAIPPAYEQVWICTDPRGHLQATGRDARRRKQYRYHPDFRSLQDSNKYHRMIAFAKALPRIREQLNVDLRRPGHPREKVLALVVSLLEISHIRIGNEEYARTNKHFGLTTLRTRHVRVEGSDVSFTFVGKSGIKHRITLHDRRLARIVKQLQELPGQELFQFVDSDGQTRSISSTDVNQYLRQISGAGFTAKDFRTWAGTVLSVTELVGYDAPSSATFAKRVLKEVVKRVAAELGNTPTVCRKCYIHPAVIDAYSSGRLSRMRFDPDQDPTAFVVRVLTKKG